MTGLAPWTVWALAGLLLLTAEMALPGVFLMWLGLAALGTGLLTRAAALHPAGEVAAFVVLGAASVGAGLLLRRGRGHDVNRPAAALVGREAVVLQWDQGRGRVRVGDSDWSARADDPRGWVVGHRLRVVALEGVTLVVGP